MRIEYPTFGHPRRPHGPRDPGDAWVITDAGERYWGRFGAAGLLAFDPARGILMQHRVEWSHHGGTWALPGGARHEGESAGAGALREAGEEAGVPADAVTPRVHSVLDVGVWTYTTVIADVVRPFDPVISDPESVELAWVPVSAVEERPLHPGFAAAWPHLRRVLDVRPTLVVDVANVMGSVPDGWWRDRVGAAGRLLGRLAALADAGIPADALGLPETTWFPDVRAVVEGQARAVDGMAAVTDGAPARMRVVRAPAAGDDAIVAEAGELAAGGRRVVVVTSDRELAERCLRAGADAVHGTRWLRDLLPDAGAR